MTHPSRGECRVDEGRPESSVVGCHDEIVARAMFVEAIAHPFTGRRSASALLHRRHEAIDVLLHLSLGACAQHPPPRNEDRSRTEGRQCR